ncbi:hypothetical protein N7478_006637 [Penicillium angulare]|uniref:uncharacterized protein n=1 Tax=Penicillium angulare TaxID=116970 RepID=UPI00254045DB|nr:uncharacterized protein N7478_006637 [Penicillium angulare]KAJ5281265.1 hypothetical protein N7478_006637 [Penicillium angulare]
MENDYDVVIVGAGISGINAAYRLQTQFPNLRYTMLEARQKLGGTWDFFKYPGLRSDSDLFTFGFEWHPWSQKNPIALAPDLLEYLDEAATQHGIKEKIQFQHRLLGADWSSVDNAWSLSVEQDNNFGITAISARFLVFGTGYYDYEKPLQTKISGIENFQGQVIHPQFWPEDVDYTDKKIVVIGSGSTAVTLLPSLAEKADVTMLQRSPTYIISVPNRSGSWLTAMLPDTIQRKFLRLRYLYVSRLLYVFSQAFPTLMKWLIKKQVTSQLPDHIPFDPHFNPRYNPWDQRLCAAPDGDFFKSLRSGRATVKTDTIHQVTSSGITLDSGDILDADIIITATGLALCFGGGTSIAVDGVPILASEKYAWRGTMLQDMPNAAFLVGYINASWTPGADAASVLVCRLLKKIEECGAKAVVPRLSPSEEDCMRSSRMMGLSSTYVVTADGVLPKAGDRGPWKARDNYFEDIKFAKSSNLEGLELLYGTK